MKTHALTLHPQTAETAAPEAKPLLEGAQKAFGMIPNMYARMANSPGMLSTYLHGYRWFREQSGFTPQEQEVVFLTISRENGCTYCMAAHSMVANLMSKVPAGVTEAIRKNAPLPDPKLAALSRFTITMLEKKGHPSDEDVQPFLKAGFSERHILEIILAIAVKTLSNYANHLFHTPVDQAFSAFAWSAPQTTVSSAGR